MNGLDDIRFPEGVRTVAVYGGTFDPPTRAHTELPIAVMNAINADWLLVIPAAVSPFKPDGPRVTNEQRLRMVELAFEGCANVTVTPIELERGGTSYTVDTLGDLCGRFSEIAFRLIIGADQAESFHRWREAKAVVELAQPAVMLRGSSDNADRLLESMAPNWSAPELDDWRRWIVRVPTIDASSTEARALLASPAPNEQRLLELLDARVLEYIRESGLYGS